MNRNIALLFIAGFFIFLNYSCKKDKSIAPVFTGTRYYPLAIGQYVIYDVDSINFFDVSMTSDTAHYQIEELIDSSFIDNTGKLAYRINRMQRSGSTGNWQTINMWYTNTTSRTAEKVEGTLRFIKLVFPIVNDSTWNGNAYINTTGDLSYLNGWVYQYSNLNTPMTINGNNLDSTVTVTQQNNEDLIQKDLEQEIYATGKGMVYKISEHVSKQDVNKSWDNPEKGYIIKMSINQFHL